MSNTKTIEITDYTLGNRFQTAIDAQDACNLRALARQFVFVVDAAMEELRDTKGTWDDPAVVLFVNKLESLCRSDDRFSAAYSACIERAEKVAQDKWEAA